MSRQDAALKAKEHEFSQDPLTLDEIEAELEANIAEYDQKIEGLDDWWIPNVMEQDDMQEKWAAQIERARYAAALNELQDYREELDDHEAKNTVDLTQRDGLSGAFDTALDNTDESLVATQPEINAPEDDVSLDSISGSFITMSNNNDATTDIRHPTPEQLSARSSHISLGV
jgi:DNA repair exonuclease SbcCD ATPase subunit